MTTTKKKTQNTNKYLKVFPSCSINILYGNSYNDVYMISVCMVFSNIRMAPLVEIIFYMEMNHSR